MRILFVDDEPGAAQALADRVGAGGFAECRAASGAQEAVDMVNDEGAFDLLVTDAFMDDCDGFTLAETLRAHLPDLRTIFLSEYDLSEYSDRVGSAEVFGKPVDPDALAEYLKNRAVDSVAVGSSIGQFRIDRVLGSDVNGPVYDAFQTNISRRVELHTFDPAAGSAEQFLASASLKANVRHPSVLAVFEAGEANGIPFYAEEPPQGASLAEFVASGRTMSPADVLQLLQTVSEAMAHFSESGISRDPLGPEDILIDHRNRARILNIASAAQLSFSVPEEIRELAVTLKVAMERTGQVGPLLQLLDEMAGEGTPIRSWVALLHEVKRRAPQSAPTRKIALDESGRAAIAAVGASRRRQRLAVRIRIIVIIILVLAAVGAGFWYFAIPSGGSIPSVMEHIPAGAVDYPDGRHADVPEFWIDQNEVSIAEYAEFLGWIDRHRGEAANLAHPNMPAGKSHVPDGWETANGKGIYQVAKQQGILNGRRLTPASPVYNVDWFDAYSYASWKGRRLPTDTEWDRLLPKADGETGAGSKVKGIDGNVSEWTMTWVQPPGGEASPVIRGGDSSSLDPARRTSDGGPLQRKPTLGFRTVSEFAPQK